MTALFDRILNFCLVTAFLAAFLGLVAVFVSDPPTKEVEPGITDVEWDEEVIDPNWLSVPVGLTMLLDVTNPEGRVCSVSPEWQMERGKAHQDKSCKEYAKLLTETSEEFGLGLQPYLLYIALCWLMDPCSKGQP